MNKKAFVWIIIVIIIVAGLALFISKSPKGDLAVDANKDNQSDSLSAEESNSDVKEFTMTSFVEMIDGKPKPEYSLKEIVVNKGDKVRIKITVTAGMHDFKIDEYGIYADTQLNKESFVEFIADKTGTFTYYCTKPGHRQNGHWGTLKVL